MADVYGNRTVYLSWLSQSLRALPAGTVEFFLAMNIILSITASLGNVLILIALHRVTSIYPPTKLFFRCLAVTDLCVGLIVQPLYVYETYAMSRATEMNANVLYGVLSAVRILAPLLCGVSILTSTAISVDRLLALLLRLRYRHVVTLRRVRFVIICFWLNGVVFILSSIWIRRTDISNKTTCVVIVISLVTSISSYLKIHLTLRQHQAQVGNNIPHGHPNEGARTPLNIAKYKKTVSSILWVQLAFVVCYVPFGIVNGIGTNNIMAWIASATLLYLNSSLNPILYCWKIREVRQAVKDTIRQLYCS